MHRKDILNLSSLICIQASNALLPLIIFPFILRVVGSEIYSMVALSEAIAIIVLAVTIYSFEIDGVSKVINLDIKKDIKKISFLFSSIFYARIFIFILCLIILAFLSLFFEKKFLILTFSWLLLPVSYIFQSLWFFQGIENNVAPAIFTLLTRLLSVVLIFFFIKISSDFFLIPLIIGSCYLFGAVGSFLYVLLKFKVQLCVVSKQDIRDLIIDGKEIFFSNLSVSLYRDFNVIILGLLGMSSVAVSVYSVTEKLIKCLQATTRPLNQFYFTKVISLLQNVKSPNQKTLFSIIKLIVPQIFTLLIIISLIITGYLYIEEYTSALLNYPNKQRIAFLFLLMSIGIVFGIFNFMIGMAGLNYLNEKTYLFKSVFFVGILNIIICFLLAFFFAEIGAVLSFIMSEFFLFLCVIKKYNTKQPTKI